MNLAAAGLTLRFVNGGGTGSLHTTSRETAVTEVTAGSAFFAPLLFDHYHDFRFQPAAGYAIQIVRQPKPGLYTCLGGGYPASGQTGPDKSPQPYLPVGARLDGNEGAGEVQTPIHYTGPEKLALGDPIFMRHAKAGELCERFNTLLLLRNGRLHEEVTTYRGDGQCRYFQFVDEKPSGTSLKVSDKSMIAVSFWKCLFIHAFSCVQGLF
jgi:D-serine deaminase-like pyridoxal phosphate-dependent protein